MILIGQFNQYTEKLINKKKNIIKLSASQKSIDISQNMQQVIYMSRIIRLQEIYLNPFNKGRKRSLNSPKTSRTK